MTEKLSSNDCSEGYVSMQLNGMLTLQEKQYLEKTTNQQSFVKKITSILASLENNQSFYSIADFFLQFKSLSEHKLQAQQANKIFC